MTWLGDLCYGRIEEKLATSKNLGGSPNRVGQDWIDGRGLRTGSEGALMNKGTSIWACTKVVQTALLTRWKGTLSP